MADFSCYVTIVNDTPYVLALTKSEDTWGHWKTAPPKTIDAFSRTSEFQLEDKAGPAGTAGLVEYTARAPGTGTFAMRFTDPVDGDNACSISNPDCDHYSVNFFASSEASVGNNACPRSGHPLAITYYIRKFG